MLEVAHKSAYSADPSKGIAAINALVAFPKPNPQSILLSRDTGALTAALVSRLLNACLLCFYPVLDDQTEKRDEGPEGSVQCLQFRVVGQSHNAGDSSSRSCVGSYRS